MTNSKRPCDTCGRPRAWHKRSSTTCGDCLWIERHTTNDAEPWTAGFTRRGLTYYPIKEHA